MAPLHADQGRKYCGFTPDDASLLVSMEDGRFFEIGFNNLGEMQGQNLLNGEPLPLDGDGDEGNL